MCDKCLQFAQEYADVIDFQNKAHAIQKTFGALSNMQSLHAAEEEKLELDLLHGFDRMKDEMINLLVNHGKAKDLEIDPDILASPLKESMQEFYNLGKIMGEYTIQHAGE